MKGTLRFILALAVMLTVVLSLGVCANADDLPREAVGYDYGMQEAAAVPTNGLTDDDLTLNGISFKARIEDGKLHIFIVDLAAANLLRDNAELAAALGLDYADLYIENGQIFVKTAGKTAEEIAAITAKLDALMEQSSPVGVSIKDEFVLASGGVDRVVVVVSDLGQSSNTAAAAPEAAPDLPPQEEIEKPTIDVKSIRYNDHFKATVDSDGNPAASDVRPAVTTVYFSYNKAQTYYIASQTSEGYEYIEDSTRYINRADIALVRGEDDQNEYYISFKYGDTVTESILFKDNNSLNDLLANRDKYNVVTKGSRNIGVIADEIYISVKSGGEDVVVKTIKLKDATPAPEDFFKDDSNLPLIDSKEIPGSYVLDEKRNDQNHPYGVYPKGLLRADGTQPGHPEYDYVYNAGDITDPNGINYVSSIENPTGEETTITVTNDVKLFTEAKVDKPEPAAPSEPDSASGAAAESAQAAGAVDAAVAGLAAEAVPDTVSAPAAADAPVEAGAEPTAEENV